MLNVSRPRLPNAESIYPYLKTIDKNRFYTNGGPLLQEFEKQLAKSFLTTTQGVATCSNATLALAQALYACTFASDKRRAEHGDLCLMPSWTFSATPASANLIGLKPYFLDVDLNSWSLPINETLITVQKLEREGKSVAAVILVSPFGALPDVKGWEEFTRISNIPVVIDAAASFDSIMMACQTQQSEFSEIPTVVSLHATKTFGIGEGAFVLSSNRSFIDRFRQLGNFGFQGERSSIIPGWNSKLSEYSAAIGLAHFENWKDIRNEWISLRSEYNRIAKALEPQCNTDLPQVSGNWVSPYGLISINGESRQHVKTLVAQMGTQGYEIRQWWGSGCHVQPAYQDCGKESLPNTDVLSSSIIGLPFWLGIDYNEFRRVIESFSELIDQIHQST